MMFFSVHQMWIVELEGFGHHIRSNTSNSLHKKFYTRNPEKNNTNISNFFIILRSFGFKWDGIQLGWDSSGMDSSGMGFEWYDSQLAPHHNGNFSNHYVVGFILGVESNSNKVHN